jgi:hypothetical protein
MNAKRKVSDKVSNKTGYRILESIYLRFQPVRLLTDIVLSAQLLIGLIFTLIIFVVFCVFMIEGVTGFFTGSLIQYMFYKDFIRFAFNALEILLLLPIPMFISIIMYSYLKRYIGRVVDDERGDYVKSELRFEENMLIVAKSSIACILITICAAFLLGEIITGKVVAKDTMITGGLVIMGLTIYLIALNFLRPKSNE